MEAWCWADWLFLVSAKSDWTQEEWFPASWFQGSCFLECSVDSACLAQSPELDLPAQFLELDSLEQSPGWFLAPELLCPVSD